MRASPIGPRCSTSVVPISVKSPSYGMAKTMRPSAFWKMYAWRASKQLRHDDVAALDEAQRDCGPSACACSLRNCAAHGPGGVDEGARAHRSSRRVGVCAARTCQRVGAAHGIAAGAAREHGGAARGGVDGAEHDEARVVDPAVRVDEALA